MSRMKWHRHPRGYRSLHTGSRPPKKIMDGYRYVYAEARLDALDDWLPSRLPTCGEPSPGATPVDLAMAHLDAKEAHRLVITVRMKVYEGTAGAADLQAAQWAADQASQVVLRLERDASHESDADGSRGIA